MDYSTNSREKQAPTLEAISKMDCMTLTPDYVALVIGSHPHSIRLMASTPEGRQGLGFPVIRIGNETKIPRAPFLRYLGWEGSINGATEVVA